jgi:hypothetical protein
MVRHVSSTNPDVRSLRLGRKRDERPRCKTGMKIDQRNEGRTEETLKKWVQPSYPPTKALFPIF